MNVAAPPGAAAELDPLATRFGAPEPLVLVSPPSDTPVTSWALPPVVEAPTSANPDGAAQPPRMLERLGQNCHAPAGAVVLPPAPAPGGPLERAATARAWLDALDVAWAPRAHRRAVELGRRGREAAAGSATPEPSTRAGCACPECAAFALVEPRGLLPAPEWTFPDELGEVYPVPEHARAPSTPRGPGPWSAVPVPLEGPARVVRRARPGGRPELVAPEDAPSSPPKAGAWYGRRAAALARPLRERIEACGQGAPLVLECACGRVKVPTSCGQRQVCRTCNGRTMRRIRAKLTKAMRARVEANARAHKLRGAPRGAARLPMMLTLTVRHSGDLLHDRTTLQRGWQRLRGWLHRRLKLAPGGRGQFDYAMTWETTPGNDGLGHVHAHVVALLPFVPFRDLRDEWVRATGGASTGIHCAVPKDKTGRRIGGDRAAARAAEYLAKYASKGVDLEDFTPELAANVLDAAWGRRVCSTSHGFWLPKPPCECKVCKERWLVVEKPPRNERQRAVWELELRIVIIHEDDGSREERWYPPFPYPGGAVIR